MSSVIGSGMIVPNRGSRMEVRQLCSPYEKWSAGGIDDLGMIDVKWSAGSGRDFLLRRTGKHNRCQNQHEATPCNQLVTHERIIHRGLAVRCLDPLPEFVPTETEVFGW